MEKKIIAFALSMGMLCIPTGNSLASEYTLKGSNGTHISATLGQPSNLDMIAKMLQEAEITGQYCAYPRQETTSELNLDMIAEILQEAEIAGPHCAYPRKINKDCRNICKF